MYIHLPMFIKFNIDISSDVLIKHFMFNNIKKIKWSIICKKKRKKNKQFFINKTDNNKPKEKEKHFLSSVKS